MIRRIIDSIIDLIYPEDARCTLCGAPVGDSGYMGICSSCAGALPFLEDDVCLKCGRPWDEGEGKGICKECLSEDIYFHSACSVFRFEGVVREAIHRLKYDGEADIAGVLGRFMARKLQNKGWKVDAVIPVPLHHRRLKDRGYNQSHLMAMEIAREIGVEESDGIMMRTRHTESQALLPGYLRTNNVKGAFDICKPIEVQGKTILMVDDIMTTGSTLNECSRILVETGAERVFCISAATPVHRREV